MMGAHDTITIWNKWRNPDTKKDEWFRHVVSKCSWEQTVVKSATNSGAVVGGVYCVLITPNPRYKPRQAWEMLSAEDKAIYWTLAVGELIALGDVDVAITGTVPNTEAQLKTRLAPNAFTAKAIDDASGQYKRGRHYEVTGV